MSIHRLSRVFVIAFKRCLCYIIAMETYYTPQEIAKQLKVNKLTVYRWIKEGRLKAVKIGRFWRVSETELKKLLAD